MSGARIEEPFDLRTFEESQPEETVTPTDETETQPDDEQQPDDTQPEDQQPDDQQQQPVGDDEEEEEPDEEPEDPRDQIIREMREEQRQEREYFRRQMEELRNPRQEPQETDWDAEVDENFEPGSKAGEFLKKMAKTMRAEHRRELEQRVGAVSQSQGAMEMKQREEAVLADLRKRGMSEKDEQAVRQRAWDSAVAARQRGERPDLESSYKAAAFDLGVLDSTRAADREEEMRNKQKKRRKIATTPETRPPASVSGGKLSDEAFNKAVGEGKGLRDIWRMEDEAKSS